ncbi:glycosyltransferase 87 family protein [Nocardia sp. CDC160]|uniref:glycosyltransferase 87 family protein n=1 Tax=Nocardia sp. CDC160 TaxID=3112166 RepID=UPI002DBF8051|nr:glycosyltransferase 87 family protein [Nocardia sp. CDC160]MEC3918004.1 glycosyltransferase 87 family protein [Nocardia sp. CDC160]
MIDGAAAANRQASQRRSIPLAAVWVVAVAGILAGAQWIDHAVMDPKAMLHLVDLDAYRIAANRVVHGVSVYDTPLLGHTRGAWEFVYTPFAAVLFAPLAALHGSVFTLVGGIANFLILCGSVWATLAILGYRRDRRMLIVVPTAAALLLFCEPIRQTVAFGQVNLLLLLLVLADMALPDSARAKGVLTGIATGIKLTPAFFILYLLVTRRYRAAATATGALAATMVIGLAMLPKDSLTYWAGGFADPSRVGVPENPDNESLRGMLARALGSSGLVELLWFAAALTLTAIGLILARRLSDTGRELPAVILCGITGTVVSPYSWIHHWVWLAPLLIYLTHLANHRRGLLTATVLLAVFVVCSGGVFKLFDIDYESVLYYPKHGFLALFGHNAYIWLAVALYAATALALRRYHPKALSA